MTSAPQIHYVADDQFDEYNDEAVLTASEVQHSEHEEVFSQDEESARPVLRVTPAASTFVFAAGHRVQPAPSAPARTVIWRGQLRECLPKTGWMHRVNVYRLDDGFRDCCREDELQAA